MRKKKKSSEGMTTLAFLVALFIVAISAGLITWKFVWPMLVGGKAEVEMPSLVGKNYQEAMLLLKEKNILIDSIIEQPNDNYAKGIVTNQQPNPGIRVKEGVKNAKLIVSTGKSEIEIPDVVNYELEAAKEELENAGITSIRVIEEASETIPTGYIIRTDPDGGRSTSASKIVDIYVSRGPDEKTFTMPNFVGKTLKYAKEQATILNFKINSKFEASAKTENTVLKQSIEAGENVKEGTEITLTVAKKDAQQPQNKQTVYINLSNKGANDSEFLVEVETSSTYMGTQKIYSGTHKNSDGEISVDVYGYGETMLKVYIDGKLDSQQALKL